jgi:hypothetical protein
MGRGVTWGWMGVLACLAAAVRAGDYRPPAGFNGHDWGAAFATFQGLTLWRANTAEGSSGKVADMRFECVPDPGQPGSSCPLSTSRTDQSVEGEGSYALGEYYFNQDRNPWVAQRIELATISYLFCARAESWYVPRPLKKHLKLCGVRVLFRSDTERQLASREVGYESNFDRILRQLVAEHGEPPGYERHGRITIESEDQRLSSPEKRKPVYALYRWCGTDEASRSLRPTCPATVTLSLEAVTGMGTILYATPVVYDYAYARHQMKDDNNELYVLLNSDHPSRPYRRVRHECTGRRICDPTMSTMSARQLRDFAP